MLALAAGIPFPLGMKRAAGGYGDLGVHPADCQSRLLAATTATDAMNLPSRSEMRHADQDSWSPVSRVTGWSKGSLARLVAA